MGVRQRAAVVVCLVATVVVGMVLAGTALAPAGAQLIALEPTSTTQPPDPTTTIEAAPTTTSRPRSSTTRVPATTPTTSGSGQGRTATTRAGSGSGGEPTTTVRRSSTTTTASEATEDETTTTSSGPTTTERSGLFGDSPTTTADALALEQASSDSGLGAGGVVALIIAGLLAVALGLSALTVRYVRATQPHDRFVA